MNTIADERFKNLNVTMMFPVLSNTVFIRRWPPNEYQIIFGKQTASISPGAVQLFLACDGLKSVYDIMKEVGDKGDADDKNQQENLLAFLLEAEKNGILTLSMTKAKTPKITKMTGSFSAHYPSHLSLELTYRCNLSCTHCYLGKGSSNQGNFIPTQQLLTILRSLHEQGLRFVELTGGEPLLHSDFFDIFDFCISTFPGVALFTNGTLITPGIANRLGKDKQKLFINISLDGSTPETHDRVRGMTGAFEKTTQAIRLLSQQGIKVRVAMATFPETESDVESTVNLAKALGASSFTFSPALPFGRASTFNWDPTNDEICIKEQKYQGIIDDNQGFIQKVGEDILLKTGIQNRSNCGAGYSRYVMSPTGDIRPCHMTSNEWFSIGNVLQDPPEKVFSSLATMFLRNLQSPTKEFHSCTTCRYRLFCNRCWVRGVNRNTMGQKPCEWFTQTGLNHYIKSETNSL